MSSFSLDALKASPLSLENYKVSDPPMLLLTLGEARLSSHTIFSSPPRPRKRLYFFFETFPFLNPPPNDPSSQTSLTPYLSPSLPACCTLSFPGPIPPFFFHFPPAFPSIFISVPIVWIVASFPDPCHLLFRPFLVPLFLPQPFTPLHLFRMALPVSPFPVYNAPPENAFSSPPLPQEKTLSNS